ncbi:MAG: hypothetical protein R3F40_16430 [Candidatus Competibacteraceae bacterium]
MQQEGAGYGERAIGWITCLMLREQIMICYPLIVYGEDPYR